MTDLPPPAPTSERVAVSGAMLNDRRILPALTADRVTREHGDHEYRAMLRDAIISANTRLYSSSVVADDPQVVSAQPDKAAADYQQASDMATWLSAQLEDLDTPIFDRLTDVMSAAWYGCRIAETVYHRDTTYTGRQQIVLHDLKPKPRRAASLAVDQFDNVRGVYAYVLDADNVARYQVLPREGFLIYSFHPQDGDPRGTSLLEAAWVPYDIKVRIWPEYYRFLVQFATPLIFGTVPPNSPPIKRGDGTMVDAVTDLLQQMLQIQNGYAIAAIGGTEINTILSQGEGQAFLTAFDSLNREMTMAILGATRATMEAQNGSKADSQTATDVLETFIRQTRLSLERAIRRQVIMPLVELNYGRAARKLAPYLSLGGVEKEDAYKLMSGVQGLAKERLIFPSQLPELHARMGLPTATAEEYTSFNTTARSAAPSGLAGQDTQPTTTPAPQEG